MSIQQGVITAAVLLAVALTACGSDEGTNALTGGGGSGGQGSTTGQGGSGAPGSGGTPPAPSPMAFVRLAHLSPGAPAIDLCVDFGDGNFIGPLLKANGLVYSLSYLDVTALFPFPAGPITHRPIPGDATSCDTPIDGARDVTITTSPGQAHTFVLIGQAQGGSVEMQSFGDDVMPAEDKLKLRLVHASPDAPNVDLGVAAGGEFQELFADVAYGAEGAASGKTYREMPALGKAALSVRHHGSDVDALVAPSMDLDVGVIATAFLIGNSSGSPKPLQLLLCKDNGPKRNYTYTPCTAFP